MGGMFSVESFSLTYISTFSLGLVDHWSFCGVKATKRMGINSHHVVGDKVSHGIPKTCVLALNQVSHANTHDINQRNQIKFNEYFGKTFAWRLQRWNCNGKHDKKECNHKVNILLISTNKEFSSKKQLSGQEQSVEKVYMACFLSSFMRGPLIVWGLEMWKNTTQQPSDFLPAIKRQFSSSVEVGVLGKPQHT